MGTSKDAVTSDTEGTEKPVRKQLQKASISRASGETLDMTAQSEGHLEQQSEEVDAGDEAQVGENAKPAPGLRKKRSHEEIEGDETDDRPAAHTRSQHTRKRSRDSTAEEDELNNGRKISGERKRDDGDAESTAQSNGAPTAPATERASTPEPKGGKRGEEKVEAMTSPKTKRSRLHSATAEGEAATATPLGEEGSATDAVTREESDKSATEQPAAGTEKKSAETKSPTIPSGSGFANTSTASPFGSVPPRSPPSDQPQTSASAFAASGFGSLAGAATSGFGALGKTSGGPAGGWASKSPDASGEAQKNGTEKSTSTFGGALGQQSGFGAAASGGGGTFGSGGSAFGGKLGSGSAFGGSGFGSLGSSTLGGGGLSSFASGKPSPFASSSSTSRPFGAPVDKDDEENDEEGAGGEDEDGSGIKSPLSQGESDKQDERFFAQEHETGEEGEVTEYSCRAKLYNFATVDEGTGKARKEWKERGIGTLRLNVAKPVAAEEGDEEVNEGEGETKAQEKAKPKARLVMRADGSHRLVLNTPVQKDIKFGAAGGGPPQGGLMLFMGAVDGRVELEMLQLKVSPLSTDGDLCRFVLIWCGRCDSRSRWSCTRRSGSCRRRCELGRFHGQNERMSRTWPLQWWALGPR